MGVGAVARAQSTIDALDQELKEVQQQHEDATAQTLSGFFSQVDPAMASPDAAVTLWQQAGGGMPAPTPVTTEYETESASEREAREEKDKANNETLGTLLQVHCGLLHYGAIFLIDPSRKGLQDDFNGWLQKAAQAYPQLSAAAAPPPPPAPASQTGDGGKHHRHTLDTGSTGTTTVPPVKLGDVVSLKLHDSLITKFLNFNIWKDKDQGNWSVKMIPQLFKNNILDPSRATPVVATLANWDIYIAMQQADEPDTDKWASNDYPPLQFERAYDDFSITPGVEKLEILVQIIHANPTHPNADDWLKRTKVLLDAYRAGHGGGGAPAVVQNNAPPPAVTNSNVTVTTEQQGDAQIITTHTNNAPAKPTP
jgi:hypothetical protein